MYSNEENIYFSVVFLK